MLDLLDNLLRQLLMDGVTGLREVTTPPATPPAVLQEQVGFRPPNDTWAAYVRTTLRLNALNVFLLELRENRKLRSNERERGMAGGSAYSDPAPARLDCHYLITAWSPIEELPPQVEPVIDEHQLLYEAAAVLLRAGALNPSQIYLAGSLALNTWPPRFREVDLPVVIGPPEGFPKLAEFWGTMGSKQPWKPALHLVVTLPVELLRESSGPMVTARITEYRQAGRPDSAEVWVQIGGHVLDARTDPGNPKVVVGAWVQLETTGGEALQTTRTNELGRFTFVNVPTGLYALRVSAVGLGELIPQRPIEVPPSRAGEYDLRFD